MGADLQHRALHRVQRPLRCQLPAVDREGLEILGLALYAGGLAIFLTIFVAVIAAGHLAVTVVEPEQQIVTVQLQFIAAHDAGVAVFGVDQQAEYFLRRQRSGTVKVDFLVDDRVVQFLLLPGDAQLQRAVVAERPARLVGHAPGVDVFLVVAKFGVGGRLVGVILVLFLSQRSCQILFAIEVGGIETGFPCVRKVPTGIAISAVALLAAVIAVAVPVVAQHSNQAIQAIVEDLRGSDPGIEPPVAATVNTLSPPVALSVQTPGA